MHVYLLFEKTIPSPFIERSVSYVIQHLKTLSDSEQEPFFDHLFIKFHENMNIPRCAQHDQTKSGIVCLYFYALIYKEYSPLLYRTLKSIELFKYEVHTEVINYNKIRDRVKSKRFI